MIWSEVYEHDRFGQIEVVWRGELGERSHLIAIQSDLWTPVEEVEDCIRWARNLQCCETGEGGDGGTGLSHISTSRILRDSLHSAVEVDYGGHAEGRE